MKKIRDLRNAFLWVGLCLLIAALVLVTAVVFGMFSLEEYPEFTLPPPPTYIIAPPTDDISPSSPAETAKSPLPPAIHLDVNPDNIQRIVSALPQMEGYRCEWTVEWFWPSGSASSKRVVFVRDGYKKIEIYNPEPDGRLNQSLTYGKGYVSIVGQTVWQPRQGDFSPEKEAALPDPGIIAILDRKDLLEAAYLLWQDCPCVAVTFRVDDVHIDTYWLSLDDGLPFLMERTAFGQVVYRCTRGSLDIGRPDDEIFRMPNGELFWDYGG